MRRLQEFLGVSGSVFRYFVGTAFLTIAIQIAYDLVRDEEGIMGVVILMSVLFGVVVAILLRDWIREQLNKRDLVVEKIPIDSREGLVLQVSTGPLAVDLAMVSINHHAATLKYCWLVHTPASESNADLILAKVHEKLPNVKDVYSTSEFRVNDPVGFSGTWQVTKMIYEERLPELGLAPKQVVSDITGGMKTMSVGMALLCSERGFDMQYVVTPRDKDGKIKEDAPQVPVLVGTKVAGWSGISE